MKFQLEHLMKGFAQLEKALHGLRTWRELAMSLATSAMLLVGHSAVAQKPPVVSIGSISKVNPASFGQFCPPGYEMVNKQNAQQISLQEQVHVEKIVKLFLHLETTLKVKEWETKWGRSNARMRDPDTNLIRDDYWKKGVTEDFYHSDKLIPARGDLMYRDVQYRNICINSKETIAILLLDIAAFGVFRDANPPEVKAAKGQAFASKRFWNASDKKPFEIPEPKHEYISYAMPENAIVYMPIPLKKPDRKPWEKGLLPDVPWVIAQSTVPYLLKLNKKMMLAYLDEVTVCDPSNQQCSPRKEFLQVKQRILRPAWTLQR